MRKGEEREMKRERKMRKKTKSYRLDGECKTRKQEWTRSRCSEWWKLCGNRSMSVCSFSLSSNPIKSRGCFPSRLLAPACGTCDVAMLATSSRGTLQHPNTITFPPANYILDNDADLDLESTYFGQNWGSQFNIVISWQGSTHLYPPFVLFLFCKNDVSDST
jgi:hypothetical protein